MFRSVSFVGTYSISCRLLTNIGNRFRLTIRTYHNNKEGIYYISLSYLCTCRWSYRSCTSYNICSLGCYHCVIKSIDWIRYLSSCRPIGFFITYDGPKYCWWKVIYIIYIILDIILSQEEFKNYYKIINHSKISLPSWVWMNCLKMINLLLPELEKSKDSFHNHSSCLKSFQEEKVNLFPLMTLLLDSEV